MNERIKELMAQAVTFRLDPDSNAYEAQVSPEDLELFAELIVKECAMYVEGFELTQEVALDEYVDFEASTVLKQYFGVEE